MKIQVHIERVFVEGLPVTRSQTAEVRRAIEAELGRLLAAGELRGGLRGGLTGGLNGATLAHLNGAGMQLGQSAAAGDVGTGIASATYASLFSGAKAGPK
jgi:hypothetical protein